MHSAIGGYRPEDIQVVAAFDIDRRKVGLDLHRAIFAEPNCAQVFCGNLPPAGLPVSMGRVLDGVSAHMADYSEKHTFLTADEPQPSQEEVVRQLVESKRTCCSIICRWVPRKPRGFTPSVLSKPVWPLSTTFQFSLRAIRPGRGDSRKKTSHHRRRYQIPTGGDDHPPRPHRSVQKTRRQAGSHLSAQHRRQHRFFEHGEPRPARFKENIQDPGGAGGHRTTAGQRGHPHRSQRLRPLAEG